MRRESFPSRTLLTCVAVCKSVQHGTVKSPLLPNSWTKSMPTAGRARRMLKTITCLRSRWRSLCFPLRGNHLLPSPPTLWCKSRAKRCAQPPLHSSASSLSGTRVGAVGERVPARDQDSLRTSVAPRRARRGCAGCKLQEPVLASYQCGRSPDTSEQIHAVRMQLKTAVVKMTAST